MSFTRTAAGLSNSAQFYDVDAIVYVEGKPQLDEESPGSLDLLFWKRIFGDFAQGLSMRIICRGGKPVLLELANQIQTENIRNVLVALDRDYDPELGSRINHPSVLYTWGYSWENDVWTYPTIDRVIRRHALIQPVPQRIVDLVTDSFSEFAISARRLARVNLAASIAGQEPVVTTREHKGLVKLHSKSTPSFNRQFFKNKLCKFREERNESLSVQGAEVSHEKHCLGHLMAFFGYHLVCSVLHNLGHKAKIDFDMMSTLVINSFDILSSDPADPKYIHYCGIRNHIAPVLT